MAYPYQVDAGNSLALQNFTSWGATSNGSNIYVVGRDDANDTLEVWKSTDGGVTWAEVDAANHKTTSNLKTQPYGPPIYVAFNTYAVQSSGTKIHIVYIAPAKTLTIADFDTATDTWGTTRTGGPDITAWGENVAYYFGLNISLVVRSLTNKFVVVYQSQSLGAPPTGHVSFVTCTDGGTWSAPVLVAGNPGVADYLLTGAAIGASNRTHTVIVNNTTGVTYHYLISSADAVGAAGVILAANFPAAGGFKSWGSVAGNGTQVAWTFGYYDGGVGPIARIYMVRANSADTPSWSTQTIENLAASTWHYRHAPVLSSTEVSHAVWARDLTVAGYAKKFYYATYTPSGSTWSAPTLMYDAGANAGVPINASLLADSVLASVFSKQSEDLPYSPYSGNIPLLYYGTGIPPANQRIRGYVLDSGGNPIPGATVTDGTHTATTGSDGSYSMDLGVGNNTVSVLGQSFHLFASSGSTYVHDFIINQTTALSCGEITESTPRLALRPSQPIAYIVTADEWTVGLEDTSGRGIGTCTANDDRTGDQSSSTDR